MLENYCFFLFKFKQKETVSKFYTEHALDVCNIYSLFVTCYVIFGWLYGQYKAGQWAHINSRLVIHALVKCAGESTFAQCFD